VQSEVGHDAKPALGLHRCIVFPEDVNFGIWHPGQNFAGASQVKLCQRRIAKHSNLQRALVFHSGLHLRLQRGGLVVGLLSAHQSLPQNRLCNIRTGDEQHD